MDVDLSQTKLLLLVLKIYIGYGINQHLMNPERRHKGWGYEGKDIFSVCRID